MFSLAMHAGPTVPHLCHSPQTHSLETSLLSESQAQTACGPITSLNMIILHSPEKTVKGKHRISFLPACLLQSPSLFHTTYHLSDASRDFITHVTPYFSSLSKEGSVLAEVAIVDLNGK